MRHQDDAYRQTDIRHIKNRKIDEVQAEHIHHVSQTHPIDEIAERTAQKKSIADAHDFFVEPLLVRIINHRAHDNYGDDEEKEHSSFKNPPGSTLVLNVEQGQDTRKHFLYFVQCKIIYDGNFAPLVQDQQQDGQYIIDNHPIASLILKLTFFRIFCLYLL